MYTRIYIVIEVCGFLEEMRLVCALICL